MRRRSFALLALAGSAAALSGCGTPDADAGAAAADSTTITVAAVGFATPESVLHDSVADVYLVSNINGEPAARDDNGFISRLGVDGQLQELKWIDGADTTVTLHAPKGMAIRGDTLYVADIDCVRRFVRTTGRPAGEICPENATFLNDLAADSTGTLYVTDTGVKADSTASGTDAVWRFTPDGQNVAKLIEGSMLGGPNGIAFRGQDGYVVTLTSGEMYQIGPNNNRNLVLPGAPGRALDGLVFTNDGGFLFSSQGDRSVLRVDSAGVTSRVLVDVDTPADIGYDAKRDRVLVPLLAANEVRIVTLPPPPAPTPAAPTEAAEPSGGADSSGAAPPSGAPAPANP
jgi:hypothetical protein